MGVAQPQPLEQSDAPQAVHDRLVPIEDLATRRILWNAVWDWLIQRCEELASQDEASGSTTAVESPGHADELPVRRL